MRLLANCSLVHHANTPGVHPPGVYQHLRVVMMNQCSAGEQTHQHFIGASWRLYSVDTLLEEALPNGRHDALMKCWRVCSPALHWCIMTTLWVFINAVGLAWYMNIALASYS